MSEAFAQIPPDLARRSSDPLGDAVFAPASIKLIDGRNFAFIPSIYTPHQDAAGTVVTQGGVPVAGSRGKLSFTVADVAPERRWAITESGEVLAQHVFESKLMFVRDEWFTKIKRLKPPDLSKEPIPTVERYVRMTPDPVDPSRLIEIGFDPNAKPDHQAERKLWDAKGEESVSGQDRLRVLMDAYHSPTLRKVLKRHELDEVEAAMGGASVAEASGLVAKLEELNAMLASGDITAEVHSRRVALLTGSALPEVPVVQAVEAKPRKRAGYSKVPCGMDVANLHKKKHIASCPACQTPTGEAA